MPIIKLNEQDLSWYYRQRQPGQLTVLMPGVATFGPCDANEGGLVLVTEDNFTKVLGTSSVDSRDLSYQIAKSYVRSGIDVLFWRIPLDGMKYASNTFVKTEDKSYTVTVSGEGTSTIDVTATEKKVIHEIKSVSINGATTTDFTVDPFEKEKATGVTLKFKDKVAANANVIITYTEGPVLLTIQAKYTGSFGNSLSVKMVTAGSDTYRVLVYGTTKTSTVLLETLLVNFLDMDSEYYFDTVNQTSEYITFTNVNTDDITGMINDKEVTKPAISWLIDQLTVGTAYKLAGGADGKYDPDTITDYLSGSASTDVFNELTDPLAHVFNIVSNAGYNNYTRFVFDKKITESEVTAKEAVIKIKGVIPEEKDNALTVAYTRDGVTATLDAAAYTYDKNSRTVTIKTAGSYKLTENDYIKVVITKESGSTMSQIDDKFIGLCENTGLALYLVDGAQNWSAEEFYSYTDLPSQSGSASSVYAQNGFNTSYAAAIGPWCSAVLTSNGVTRMLPGSYVLLTQWAQSLASGVPLYYAPAGVKRASLNFVNSTAYPVGSAVLELWQNQDKTVTDGHKLIPITNLRQYGYVVYGNSTLLKNLPNGATSMLQSLSTRILANAIKSRAFDISLTLQFDQLSSDLFIEFREKLNVFMSQLKYNNALYDYQIIADASKLTLDDLNNRTVPVKIRISPLPAAENFVIDLEISQAGISFGTDSLE